MRLRFSALPVTGHIDREAGVPDVKSFSLNIVDVEVVESCVAHGKVVPPRRSITRRVCLGQHAGGYLRNFNMIYCEVTALARGGEATRDIPTPAVDPKAVLVAAAGAREANVPVVVHHNTVVDR